MIIKYYIITNLNIIFVFMNKFKHKKDMIYYEYVYNVLVLIYNKKHFFLNSFSNSNSN